MSVQLLKGNVTAAAEKERSLASLEAAVDAAAARGTTTVSIDMSGIDWLSPEGAEHLVHAYRRGREAGVRIAISRPSPRLRRLLSLLALDRALLLD